MQTDFALWLIVSVATLIYAAAILAEIALPVARSKEVRAQAAAGDAKENDTSSTEPIAERGNDAMAVLVSDASRFLTGLLALKTLSLVTLSVAVARLLPETLGLGESIAVGVGLAIVILFGHAVTRGWIVANVMQIARRVTPFISVLLAVVAPITWVMRAVAGRSQADDEESLPEDVLLSESGLRLLMKMGKEEYAILESEKEMIVSILEMDETAAREVMVPRMDMVTLQVDTTMADALDVIMDAGHSRIPVYTDNVDQIVGILYAKDLLRCYRENRVDAKIQELLRPAYFVPLSKRVNTLLRDMQKNRVHIAMVVDEYGGIAGLVTIEDILEEIVGDIQDEYDFGEEAYWEPAGPDVFLLNSRLDLYTLERLLDVEITSEDADTLGGLIYSVLGHVPAQGETTELEGWRFTVLGVDGNRIDQVRAERVEHADAQAADEARDQAESTNGRYVLSTNSGVGSEHESPRGAV